MIRVADYIISFIYKNLDVKEIFMVSGGGIMHLTDAISCHKKIKYVCCHHEQAVVMATDGYARARDGFGASLVTSGPGATNAITGVVGAWQDSIPLFVISGQAKKKQTVMNSGLKGLRQFGVQEVNILPIVESFTKYAVMVNEPEKIRYYLEKAAYLAKSGRPGPVWIDVPLDVQGFLIDPEKLIGFSPKLEKLESTFDAKTAERGAGRVLSDIKKARRPLIIAGHGIRSAKAIDDFTKLVKTINVPVVTPRLGIDLMPTNHRLYIGRPGIKGDRAANFALQNADLVLCIGTRLSVNVTGHQYDDFARGAEIIVVDVDEVEHKKPTVKINKFIKQDAYVFINVLLRLSNKHKVRCPDDWSSLCLKWKRKYPVVLPEYKNSHPINTYYFTKKLCENLKSKDVIVIDSGSSSYVVSQSVAIKKGQLFIASGGLGSMGYALPASIGASVGRRGGRIICITGDGSLQMNIQELQTIVHYGLPVKIFIFNNAGYSSIKNTQDTFFNKRYVGVDANSGVSMPDTLKIAKAYGIRAVRLRDKIAIDRAIKKTLGIKGPAICDVICSKNQLVIPTVFSQKLADGTMVSKPLEDMYPFLDREEFKKNMIINLVDE